MVVKVFLNPGNKYIGKGEIDIKANIAKIKEDIVAEFKLGDPNEYIIYNLSLESRTPDDNNIQDGNSIGLLRINNPSFRKIPD